MIDFLIREDHIAIEVKVTKPGRGEKELKPELLMDINTYERHPDVQTLLVVVFDMSGTFRNPAGFENDLSGHNASLDVHVIVVGWPVSPTVPEVEEAKE